MLSAPSLPGNGNNWRQNCFRDCRFFFFFFWYMKEWGLRELLDICFCSSTQCRGWYVPPDGWNCVISRPLWCWHRNLLPHGVSWDSHHSKGGKKNALSFHQCHTPTTQDWVKIFASFSTINLLGHIPRVCSLFIIQSYCFTYLSRGKVATSS